MRPAPTLSILLALVCPLLALAGESEAGEKKNQPHVVLAVGGAHGEERSKTLENLKARLAQIDAANSTVIFTGNYSKEALPKKGESGRDETEREIRAHVEATLDYAKRGGHVYYLPGHLDFPNGNSAAVHRLKKLLNNAYVDADDDSEAEVMPIAGCGDVKEIEINKNLTLVLVDSQWWMQDAESDPEAGEGCEVITRLLFDVRLGIVLNANRTKRVIVASHHPLRSNGPYGGGFGAQAHLSPLPLVGSAVVLAKSGGLVEQYQSHPLFQTYANLTLRESERYGSYVYVSGHDESLQYLKAKNQNQVIAGSSANAGVATISGGPDDFGRGEPGWAEITVEPSGVAKVKLVAGAAPASALFEVVLPEVKLVAEKPQEPPKPFPADPVMATYTKRPVWNFGLLRLLIGTYYSDAYRVEMPYHLLDLETEQGGLKPKRAGGGQQTNSLILVDARGGEWAMRAVTKESSRSLSWPENKAFFLTRAIEHGYTAIQPEASLAIPRLADALDVLHSEPRLMYLPDQTGLGQFRGFVGDEVVLLEQRPKLPDEGTLPKALVGDAGPDDKVTFKSTDDTIVKVMSKPGKHSIDQEAMLRARLLDIFLGDWDRHEDQWRFVAITDAQGRKRYRPIARDRDQALASYDGAAFALARVVAPKIRVLQPFGPNYPQTEWLNYNARNIDRTFLNQISHERWRAIAKEAQATLSDQVIDEALSAWHSQAYELDGKRVRETLRARRDQLAAVADDFFSLVNTKADVVASTHDDDLELTLEKTGAVHLVIRPRGEQVAYFDRVYQPNETDELRIYALEGDDSLVVRGRGDTSIDIHFVGGPGDDKISGSPEPGAEVVEAGAIEVYDSPKGATIASSVKVDDERSTESELNHYDRFENHEPSFGTLSPYFIVNPDVGAYIGARYAYTVQGYKKDPFAARHELGAALATATLGVAADYWGLFPRSVGVLDQHLEASLRTPAYTRNFFGLTNQFIYFDNTTTYYRLLQARYDARYGLSYAFGGQRSRVGAQALGQIIITESTPNRFVSFSPDVRPEALGTRFFVGGRLFAETETFDNLVLPTQGLSFQVSVEGRHDIGRPNQFSVTYKGAAGAVIPIDRERRFVLLTRAFIEGIVGPHPFYLAPSLGAGALRAYRYNQLAGDVAFAQTTDLRIDVLRFATGLPGAAGVNLSIDHGRVFGTTVPSTEYHLNYGGGLWWSVLDLVGFSFSYYRSLEGAYRFVFAVGPLFAPSTF